METPRRSGSFDIVGLFLDTLFIWSKLSLISNVDGPALEIDFAPWEEKPFWWIGDLCSSFNGRVINKVPKSDFRVLLLPFSRISVASASFAGNESLITPFDPNMGITRGLEKFNTHREGR